MTMETWGQTPKSQSESTLIEDAIASAIASHEADPEAHLGEDESLQTHKSYETIDHPAESIVQDKYSPFSLDPVLFNNTKYIFRPWYEPASYWQKLATGDDGWVEADVLGSVLMQTGILTNNYARIYPNANFQKTGINSLSPMMQFTIAFWDTTNQLGYFTCGDVYTNSNTFGFKISNNKLYAYWKNGSTEYTQELITVVSAQKYSLRCQYIYGDGIYFYIDNQLVHYTSTNLPTAGSYGRPFDFYLKTTENASKYLDISNVVFIKDL